MSRDLPNLPDAAADLYAIAQQYKNDLMFGLRDEGSRQRRIRIEAALAKAEGRMP
jgi:hypothetical protein